MNSTTFLGLTMAQQDGIIPALNNLLRTINPSRVIELGTGAGGLTVLLGLYGYETGCEVYTYDHIQLTDAMQDRRAGEHRSSLLACLRTKRSCVDI